MFAMTAGRLQSICFVCLVVTISENFSHADTLRNTELVCIFYYTIN